MTSDNSDPFWMFNNELVNSSKIKLPGSLENKHTRLGSFDVVHVVQSAMTSFGVSLAVGYAVDKFFEKVEQESSRLILNDLLEFVSHNLSIRTIYQVTFDLILISYPHYYLKSHEIAKNPAKSSYIKGTYNFLTSNKKKSTSFKESFFNFIDSLVEVDSKRRDIIFESVSININRRVFAFVTNCYAKYGQTILTEEEYTNILSYFIKDDWMKIDNITPYHGDHKLGNHTILNLITSSKLKDTTNYFESKYQMYKYVLDQSDYKIFEERLKSN